MASNSQDTQPYELPPFVKKTPPPKPKGTPPRTVTRSYRGKTANRGKSMRRSRSASRKSASRRRGGAK